MGAVNNAGSTVSVEKQAYGSIPGALSPVDAVVVVDDNDVAQVGSWRDGICSCFSMGLCHPYLCMSCWCTPCALGQVMTRMGLNSLGEYQQQQQNNHPFWTTFKIIVFVTVVYYILDTTLGAIVAPYGFTVDSHNKIVFDKVDVPPPVGIRVAMSIRGLLELGYFLYVLIIMIRTRAAVRRQSGIPSSSPCEDCCCSYWCSCCTVAQMARHTSNVNRYEAACCTDTGLVQGRNASGNVYHEALVV